MSNTNPSIEQLKKAIEIKEQITRLESELARVLGGAAASAPAATRGGMSASARAKIAAAQRARWARVKGTAAPAKPAAKSGRRKMSAAARAKIAAAARARWARVRAGKA